MIHPDVQLIIAHDIQRQRMEAAAQYRLARAVRGDRVRRLWYRRTPTARQPGLVIGSAQLEPC